MKPIQQYDEAVVLWVREYLSCPLLDMIMKAISFLGNHGMIWIILTILFFIIGKREKRNWRNWAVVLGGSLALSACITNIFLKPFIARIRPYDKLYLDIIVPALSDFSFPSGHTTAAFASAVVIWNMDKKWGKVIFLFAAIMAFSRIYLSVHYPTDVIVGALVGSLSAGVILYIAEKTKIILK